MKSELREITAAAFVGVVAGLSSIILSLIIQTLSSFGFSPAHLLAGGLLTGFLTRFAREARGHGVPEIIKAILKKNGRINLKVPVIKLLASGITIGTGGSSGREGPIAQIGAGFGSFISEIFPDMKKFRKMLVTAGVAAGISAAFNAPIGGTLFALEVIPNPGVSPLPVLISAVIGDLTTALFEGKLGLVISAPSYRFELREVPFFILSGVFFGMVSVLWVEIFYFFEKTFEKLRLRDDLKPAVGALLTYLSALVFGKEVLGTGYESIELATSGRIRGSGLKLAFGKILATSFTVGSGASGGIFAPSLYIGALSGAFLGGFMERFNIPSGLLSIIGMASVFGASARAPLTALVIVPEMTGNYWLFVPLAISIGISYIVHAYFSESIYWKKLVAEGISKETRPNLLRDVEISEIMVRNLFCLRPDTPVEKAIEFLAKTGINEVPVVDNKEFLGFVRLTDLIKHAGEGKTIRDVTIPIRIFVKPEHTAYDALRAMISYGLSRVPVAEFRNDRLVLLGIVTKHDIISAYEKLLHR